MHTTTRTRQITAELRDEILRGRYRPGERLPSQRDLAERFAVHRGAVREALAQLEQLGLAEVRRGGARVAPLHEASLSVVEHLLDLDDPPDPVLVDQILEVFSALMSTAVRLGVERGSDAQLDRAQEIVRAFSGPELDEDQYQAQLHELAQLFLDASQNLVLRLARNGIRDRVIDRLHRSGVDALPPFALLRSGAREFESAIARRDGAAASAAMTQLLAMARAGVVKELESRRAKAAVERARR